jgi:hypothetical protein
MGLEFIPLDDIRDDAEAIVDRIRSIAGEDKPMLKSAHDNLAVADEELDRVIVWKKDTRRRRGEGSPHGGKPR